MHALCKTLFFTTGSVGLLILVFLWSALEYGLFKLNHLIEAVLSYQFAGFFITDFLLLSADMDPGLKIHTIKLVITAGVGLGSIYLIILSYLPKISWQFKSLSFAVSLFLFSFLTLFWLTLFHGHEIILNREKNAIFGFTVVTYLVGIFSIWYSMKKKSVKTLKKSSKVPVSRPPAVQSGPEKTVESLEEKEDAPADISLNKEDASTGAAKEAKADTPEISIGVDSTQEADIDGNTPESIEGKSVSSEGESASVSSETEELIDSEPSTIEEELDESTYTNEDPEPLAEDATEESEEVGDLDNTLEFNEKNPA